MCSKCLILGESGAGKTEATKQIMRYFAAAKSGAMDLRIQNAIMAANPVLEAFGNAKTVRNNNSSRFGRFMQLDVAKEGGIRYGSVVAFLLEKSRVLTQDENERSYHIFYQLVKGADSAMREKYSLLPLDKYKFINPKCFDVNGIDDLEEYKDVCTSFKSMRLSDEEIDSIWSIISGVLLLGNAEVTAKPDMGIEDAACIEGENLKIFNRACQLLFIDADAVLRELTQKVTFAGGQRVESRWKREDGDMLKSSLAKAVYEKLFYWIIRTLNKSIEPTGGFQNFMGMLDIFGFEVFKNNSLEQFFINVTNEMLQKNFVDIVFDRESRLYKEEGVSTADLVFTSNKEVIQVLTDKKNSILSALEDQCLAPGGTDEKFLAACKNAFKNSTKFKPAKVSPNINFVVTHTIGDIQYNGEGFLFKNKDVLRAEIMEVIQASENPVVKGLFEGIVMEKGKIAKGQLIGSQFLKQLDSLMELINVSVSTVLSWRGLAEGCTSILKSSHLTQVLILCTVLVVEHRAPFRPLCQTQRHQETAGLVFVKSFNSVACALCSRSPAVASTWVLVQARLLPPQNPVRSATSLNFRASSTLNLVSCDCRRPFKDFLYQFKFIDLGISENKALEPRVASERLIERCKLAKSEYQVTYRCEVAPRMSVHFTSSVSRR